MASPAKVWPGRPYPLGATWDGKGVNFALFSAHAEKVELCLFDRSGSTRRRASSLPEYTDEVWHCYLPEARPNQLYGYRVYGPYDPAAGHRFNPNKLLIDPYARALQGRLRWSDALFGYRVGSPREDLAVRPPRQRPPDAEMPGRRERLHLGQRPPPAHLVGRDRSSSRCTCAALRCGIPEVDPSAIAAPSRRSPRRR